MEFDQDLAEIDQENIPRLDIYLVENLEESASEAEIKSKFVSESDSFDKISLASVQIAPENSKKVLIFFEIDESFQGKTVVLKQNLDEPKYNLQSKLYWPIQSRNKKRAFKKKFHILKKFEYEIPLEGAVTAAGTVISSTGNIIVSTMLLVNMPMAVYMMKIFQITSFYSLINIDYPRNFSAFISFFDSNLFSFMEVSPLDESNFNC